MEKIKEIGVSWENAARELEVSLGMQPETRLKHPSILSASLGFPMCHPQGRNQPIELGIEPCRGNGESQ